MEFSAKENTLGLGHVHVTFSRHLSIIIINKFPQYRRNVALSLARAEQRRQQQVVPEPATVSFLLAE